MSQNSNRDRMNVSADYIHNSHNSSNLNEGYAANQMGKFTNTESDDEDQQ